MESSILYSITDSFDVEQIPTVWKNIDFNTFSEGKNLYPYQREALENALKILYKFYQNNSKKENEALKKKVFNKIIALFKIEFFSSKFISLYICL